MYKSETNEIMKGEATVIQLQSKRQDYKLHAPLSDETRHRKTAVSVRSGMPLFQLRRDEQRERRP